MIKKEILLEKLDNVPLLTEQPKGFNPRPEDRGKSLHLRLRRLLRYRGVYISHIWRLAQERIKLLSSKDVRAKTFWGRELVLPRHDSNARTIYESGVLDANENGLIRFFTRELRPDDVFYDIGANYGFYTALAQELVSEGEIHAFEPGSRVFSYLQQLEGQRTFLNEIALSNVNGNVEFFDSYASDTSGKSTISPQVANDHPWHYKTVTVQAVMLDEYCQTHKAPTIIKMDVEGAEADVLMGAKKMFNRVSPIIAVELWSGEDLYAISLKTLEVFKELRYSPFFIEHSGDLKETTYDYLEDWLKTEQKETNMVFKRNEAKI